ncbi:MBL fold metallo-hydrolase [Candidatus Gracilibacteria bacterium]|nr:MBL fold metallo-hydrolase [Candidatus Gracilibacteria bacterium]
MAEMILLGVGTGVPDADRENTHMVWNGPGGPLLIDVGGSTYQRLLRAGIDPPNLAGVFLTHSHPDHIHGLPVLLFSIGLAGRRAPLPIYGLGDTLAIAEELCRAMRLDYSYVVQPLWRSIAAGESRELAADWQLDTALTAHSKPCLATRFVHRSGAALVYSCDTEPCIAVEDLARGAQILIHEATTAGPFAGHTSPQQAGEVAARAGVGQLVLVHYSPRWTMPETEALAAVYRGGFQGVAAVGREGQRLSLDITLL